MALVSYGSSGESDVSDSEDVIESQPKVSLPSAVASHQDPISGNISEDDDDDWTRQQGPDLEDLDIPGLSTSRSLFSFLPQVSKTAAQHDDAKNFVDENEDLSTIPVRKEYEKEAPVIPTVKTKKGPVRIFAPTVSNDSDDEDAPKTRFVPRPTAGKKSTLLSLIPAPKNASASKSGQTLAPSTSSATKTSAFVPRSIARPPVKTVKASSSKAQDSSDDEADSVSFFTFEKEGNASSQVKEPPSFNSKIPTVQTTPDTFPAFEPCYKPKDDEIYGSAIAPYPPEAPTAQAVPDEGLLEDQEAMQRIIGRKAKIGEINFVEVNNDDIKPDPRDWMVKALSEDRDGQPGPKNTIKGDRKRKHQITYLAAMAKENEHVLKQQWSQNAHTRRATQSKYGF